MKHFILPIALGLALVSCNRDNDNATAETPILPIKIVDGDGVTEFKYNGDRLTEMITNDGKNIRKSIIEYKDDLISIVSSYDVNSNKLVSKTTYTYVNGKLTEATNMEKDSDNREYIRTHTYTYNPNGTIKSTVNDGGNITTSIITITNGNYVKEVTTRTDYFNKTPYEETYTYKYDTKNNPFKNVKGSSAILVHSDYVGNVNNLIESVQQSPHGTYTTTYTYDYNANNFPTKRTMTNSNAGKEETTYTYNK